MDRFEIGDLKIAASGLWEAILVSVCGVPTEVLDGKHHPCPSGQCSSTHDAFRVFDDFKESGGSVCNQCGKKADGIATVMWLRSCDFKTAVHEIGNFLGLKPAKRKKKNNPSSSLEFLPWNDMIVGIWCLKKKPIEASALKKIGARLAKYQNQFTVIAIPVWVSDPENIVGWNLYNATGSTLPGAKGSDNQVKVKLTYGSKPGLMGFLKPETKIYKTEGPTDLLSMISVCPSESNSFVCNANGAGENPDRTFAWLPPLIDGQPIRVIHDCDNPGQEGATMVGKRPGWSPWFASLCHKSEVKNIVLPYPIEPKRGKDIRDWFSEGNTWKSLEEIEDATEPVGPMKEIISKVWEADDDPHRLAKVNIDDYEINYGGKLVFYKSEWWKYKRGQYRRIEIDELKAKVTKVVRGEFERIWKEKQAPEKPVQKVSIGLIHNVVAAMASICSIPSSVSMPCWLPDRKRKNYLSFTNGTLDLDSVFAGKDFDECLMPHTSDWFSAFRLDYEWNPEAECPKWLQFLDDSMEQDDDRIAQLQEWAGYLLTNKNEYQRFLVLEGEGKNGKTVFFAAITAMLGEDNVSHVSMENFGGRFDLGTTLGKAANIAGDVGEIDQLAEGVLKQFTGGDTMQFDRKNLQPVQARPTAKMMAAWNQRPRVKDRSDGLWRRLLLVPFRYEVPEEKRVYGMDQPEWWIDSGEAPGIILWAITGLHRLRINKKFTKCDVSDDAMADYKLDSNPMAEFFSEVIEENPDGSIDTKHLYDLYTYWCKESGLKPFGARLFGKELKRKIKKVERVRIKKMGKLTWYYQGICFSTSEIFEKSVHKEDMF